MLRLLVTALALAALAACSPPVEQLEPPSPATKKLLELTRKPSVDIDPADAPGPPKGFTTAAVHRLAEVLADAAGRIDALAGRTDVDHRTAADSTFSALDMRTRVEFSRLMDSTERRSGATSLAWVVTDRFERGSRPVGPARVVKAAWSTRQERGWLTVSLQVVRAHLTARGEPMLVDRTFDLHSSGQDAGPLWIEASASLSGIDRCHVVETGRFRPEHDPRERDRSAAAMARQLADADITERTFGDFAAGC